MGVNFIKKHEISIISKNSQNCIEIKLEIENVDFVRQKLWVENFEACSIFVQKVDCSGWMDGWMGGWVDGSKSRVKDCLQQSINYNGGQFYKK